MLKAAETRQPDEGRPRLEWLFLIAGLLAVNVWIWSMVRTAAIQRQESRLFEREVRSGPPRGTAPPAAILKDTLIGRLTVPRLHLSAMVREGDGAGTLDVALGHIPGTALPGETGTVAVAGHRDTLFRRLGQIRPKDIVVFETLQGTYQYQVESTEIVEPTEVSVLQDGKRSKLTLVTCYPFSYIGAAPQRFIVTARPLKAAQSKGLAANLR